ncbi:MAG: AmmeMemoRadiSam system protein B [Bacteroidales bacterium]|nr:AmmeMemoRadiSam system protein B [Bacteroidales bacterium]MCF8390789.1 AmmeMemoRadiSam system protein B [Bacteroidales bacterium]
MNRTIRTPFVSGSFYPGTEKAIRDQLENIKVQLDFNFLKEIKVGNIFGCVLPHAGHIYSAYQSLAFFELIRLIKPDFESFVLLHPLHHGGYLDFASDSHDYWETPMGTLKVDKQFVDAMGIETSSDMLNGEHSAEVILPYIQFYDFNEKLIVPVGIGTQNPVVSKKLADMIIKAQNKTNRKVCVIASSDFSHFLSPREGFKQDQLVLEAVQKRMINQVYHSIIQNNISVCGYGPIMALMEYSRLMNPEYETKILARGHSGEVRNSDRVVDYISILFYE